MDCSLGSIPLFLKIVFTRKPVRHALHCCNSVHFCMINRNTAPAFVKFPAILLLTFSSWLQRGQAAQTSDIPTEERLDLSSAVNLMVN